MNDTYYEANVRVLSLRSSLFRLVTSVTNIGILLTVILGARFVMREDLTLGLRLDVGWPEVSYYGFAPRVTLTGRRTWSDVDIYDRNEFSLGLTVVSRF